MREDDINMNEEERDSRMQNLHHSLGAKKGWLRHRSSYMRGNRKRSRREANQTLFGIANELRQKVENLHEVKVQKDNVFDLEYEILLENMSGGLSFNINQEDGNISFSVLLDESGHGNYKLENGNNGTNEFKALYNDLKDEFETLANTIDESMKQILAKHGLRET